MERFHLRCNATNVKNICAYPVASKSPFEVSSGSHSRPSRALDLDGSLRTRHDPLKSHGPPGESFKSSHCRSRGMAATACGSADPACRQLPQRMPRSTQKLPGLLSFWQSTTWLCIIKILSNPLPTSLVNHGGHASMFEEVSSDFPTAKPA